MGAGVRITDQKTGATPEALARRVAEHYRLEVAELDRRDLHAHKLLPGRVARKLQVLPLRYSDRHLWVATADPVSLESEREIGRVSGRNVHFEIAPPSLLAPAVEATYPDDEPVHVVPPLDTEARGGHRVLVVDDDADTRHLLRAALEADGVRGSSRSCGTASRPRPCPWSWPRGWTTRMWRSSSSRPAPTTSW